MKILLLKKSSPLLIGRPASIALALILIFGLGDKGYCLNFNNFNINSIINIDNNYNIISSSKTCYEFYLSSSMIKDTTGPGKVVTNFFKGPIEKKGFIDSTKTGVVVIKVCVDSDGNVISAKYVAEGSTTSDELLVQKAINDALQWKFDKSEIKLQCGTFTYRYLLP